jgi:hypothetical protein
MRRRRSRFAWPAWGGLAGRHLAARRHGPGRSALPEGYCTDVGSPAAAEPAEGRKCALGLPGVEQRPAQLLEQAHAGRGHHHPAPAAAGMVQHCPHQREPPVLAGQPADHLDPTAGLPKVGSIRLGVTAPCLVRSSPRSATTKPPTLGLAQKPRREPSEARKRSALGVRRDLEREQ